MPDTMTNTEDITSIVAQETALRRTFAIISHPDAGKTTLTEKLLLYAGMIRTAGMVRGRKAAKVVSSDWMKMEQERGISITASAMQFRYKDVVINVLDTPGHQDFSEDTYRTLTAADSAVMVIDAGKGVEAQTRKLFAVCRMRGIPILTFMNKCDLPAKDPFELMAEVEDVLKIKAAPLNWPIGLGKEFCGVANCLDDEVMLFERSSVGGALRAESRRMPAKEALEKGEIPQELYDRLCYELELLQEAGNPFSREAFLNGTVTPIFFGSALTNFGVEPFFDGFADLAPPPGARIANTDLGEEISIDPVTHPFSGYVFKIQANMDPRHRDSMAFIRVCSGRFERDTVVIHHRLGSKIRCSRSHTMFGGERSTIDHAYPGDIVGVVNPGVFIMGDSVSLEGGFRFKALPHFPPEVVGQIRPLDVSKRKAFDKAMEQFSGEGTVLVLKPLSTTTTESLIAAVGKLQFEVLQYRLQNEYRVEAKLDVLPYQYGAWLIGDPKQFKGSTSSMLAEDTQQRVIVLYCHDWEKAFMIERNPEHQLREFLE